MSAYRVFKHPEKGYQAVKRGFSWPGFFFTGLWALACRMWLTGIILVAFAIPLSKYLLVFWHENPLFYSAVQLIFGALVGFNGNFWRSNHLQNRGYFLIGTINARDRQDALAKIASNNGVIPAALKAGSQSDGLIAMPAKVQGLLAIVALTWKAAFRYRLFWVLASLLLAAVVGLPLLIKDDGTSEGFVQVLITYTLGAVTGLLGLCTLWLACGTLARDVEECQMQMVAVKPISRWQIWLGKWLGLVSLNAVLLALAGMCIYGLLEWRARKLPPEQLAKLQNEVLVARASVKPDSVEKDIQEVTDKMLQERMSKAKAAGVDVRVARQQIEAQVRAEQQVVPPDYVRSWVIHLGSAGARLKGEPLFLRIKFNSAQVSHPDTFYAQWQAGVPQKSQLWQSEMMSLAPDTFHEFEIPPDLFDNKGDLTILFRNPNETALLFPLDEGMEVLYREGNFGLNFIRGLGIILCWMSLLATLGLASASFLSFPVAAFFSVAVLAIGLSSGTLSTVVSDGTIVGFDSEKSAMGHSAADYVIVPAFHGILSIIEMVQQFSPIDSLSTGRSITWTQLGTAVSEIILLLGGIIGLFGVVIFTRRELATAQGTH
ncbi:MAG: ABC-type transport system involved in multi-copper enzyme maturation, permease component [Pedosphaera sp.]|nr:ABC-type transport system involved in multi-copper enzyme maturation, permease component [Pedosphaera sp.]